MKKLTLIIALLVSANAFAMPDNEKIMQRRGEVREFYSMSELLKDKDALSMKEALIEQCKEARSGDTQCEEAGTEPVLALVHFTAGMSNKAIIASDLTLKSGQIVLAQGEMGKVMRVKEVLQEDAKTGVCGWKFAFRLMGSQRIECVDDEKSGWEETRSILEYYPLKHQ